MACGPTNTAVNNLMEKSIEVFKSFGVNKGIMVRMYSEDQIQTDYGSNDRDGRLTDFYHIQNMRIRMANNNVALYVGFLAGMQMTSSSEHEQQRLIWHHTYPVDTIFTLRLGFERTLFSSPVHEQMRLNEYIFRPDDYKTYHKQ